MAVNHLFQGALLKEFCPVQIFFDRYVTFVGPPKLNASFVVKPEAVSPLKGTSRWNFTGKGPGTRANSPVSQKRYFCRTAQPTTRMAFWFAKCFI